MDGIGTCRNTGAGTVYVHMGMGDWCCGDMVGIWTVLGSAYKSGDRGKGMVMLPEGD